MYGSFSRIKKLGRTETRTRDRMYCQTIETANTDRQTDRHTDILKVNYSIDVDTCKTVHKKAREDTRKHNLDEMRETIEASRSLKKGRRTHNVDKKPDDITEQTVQRDPSTTEQLACYQI